MASCFREHALALAVAVGIGLLFGLPNIFFVASLGSGYRDIPLLQTPNEGSYLARIQEIVDGHGALGSPFLFEYKDAPPLSPPTGEWLYALPSVVLHVSPANVLIASKFVLPPLFFLLIYALMLRLAKDEGAPRKITAIACGLCILLGYDLVDYRTVFSYLHGTGSPSSFLLWARPVNPILGGIFLFSFLIAVVALIRRTQKYWAALAIASVSLACMFASYFFSWGIALSVLAALIGIFFLKREYALAGSLSLIVPLAGLLSSPYWYESWQASQSPLYASSVLRSGLFLTQYPLLNKFSLAVFLFYLLVIGSDFLWKKRKGIAFQFEAWHWFSLAILLGSLWAYSQQILTGRTIWPYHFVQYTIPLGIVVVITLLHNVIRDLNRYAWGIVIATAALSSVYFGMYVQVKVYAVARPIYSQMQSYSPLFAFLNEQEKECVVLVNETSPELSELNILIPAFTHCNRYASGEFSALIPDERATDSYLSLLRLRGVSANDIGEYLRTERSEAKGYLHSNWQGLFGVRDFPDFSDPLLEKRLQEFPYVYRLFLKKDFRTALKKYRLDYILSASSLDEQTIRRVTGLKRLLESGGNILYAFN